MKVLLIGMCSTTAITIKRQKVTNWKRFGFESLSIFIAVVAAFALDNWNENRKEQLAESKILTEVYNGLGTWKTLILTYLGTKKA